MNGAPGHPAEVPSVYFYADGADLQDPAATLLGGIITAVGAHTLRLDATGLPAGSPAVLVHRGGGTPKSLGAAASDGSLHATADVANPATGEDWWFAVICPPGTTDCGTGEAYSAVTAPIWAQAASSVTPATPAAPAALPPGAAGTGTGRLPATGGTTSAWPAAALVVALLAAALRRRTTAA